MDNLWLALAAIVFGACFGVLLTLMWLAPEGIDPMAPWENPSDEDELCGETDALGLYSCAAQPHPADPDAHYYRRVESGRHLHAVRD